MLTKWIIIVLKFEIIEFSMIYYDIITWVVKFIQTVAYDM
jgi:hypothetical protein